MISKLQMRKINSAVWSVLSNTLVNGIAWIHEQLTTKSFITINKQYNIITEKEKKNYQKK